MHVHTCDMHTCACVISKLSYHGTWPGPGLIRGVHLFLFTHVHTDLAGQSTNSHWVLGSQGSELQREREKCRDPKACKLIAYAYKTINMQANHRSCTCPYESLYSTPGTTMLFDFSVTKCHYTWAKRFIILYSRKSWWFGGPSATAKLKSAKNPYSHVYVWRFHSESPNLNSANIFKCQFWIQTAKFNDHQYFRLYSTSFISKILL